MFKKEGEKLKKSVFRKRKAMVSNFDEQLVVNLSIIRISYLF